MDAIIECVSGLSSSTIVAMMIISGCLSVVVMVALASYKRLCAKWIFVLLACVSQVCTTAIAINQVVTNENNTKKIAETASAVYRLNEPSYSPLSEKSRVVKGAIERAMSGRWYYPVDYREYKEGILVVFSAEENGNACAYVFMPAYTVETIGALPKEKVDEVVVDYIFNDYPFLQDGETCSDERDFVNYVSNIVTAISDAAWFRYSYDGEPGFYFHFEESDTEFHIYGSRLEQLMSLTRFELQDRLFKLMTTECFNVQQ